MVDHVFQVFRRGFWMRPHLVLQDVSFRLGLGATCGLVGPNGAGKTTLLHLIVGLREPSRGRVTLGGESASSLRARERIGYLPERSYFPTHLTGDQFLTHFGILSGLTPEQLKDRKRQVFDQVGMARARKRELASYSKGMLQRIGIGQALLHDPELLVLDEPMSGLDPDGRREIRELIRELTRTGKTCIFSSHVFSDVEALCDDVIVLSEGKEASHTRAEDWREAAARRTEILFGGVTCPSFPFAVEELPSGYRTLAESPKQARERLEWILGQGGELRSFSPWQGELP